MTPPRKVLLAYDKSPGAAIALEHLARQRAGLPDDVETIVLCVADMWSAPTMPSFSASPWAQTPLAEGQLQAVRGAERLALKQARRIASEARQELQAARPAWEIRTESYAESPAEGIVRRAQEWPADLIVLGSHGRSALGRLILGSVAQEVLREAPCAVRIVRGFCDTREAPAHLIIGFDGSPGAEAAVQAVAERVWPAGSTVRLVTAVDGRRSTIVPAPRGGGAWDRRKLTWMRRMIEDPIARLHAAGLFVSPVVRLGDPERVLVEEARRWDADGLFVGARGLRGIKRLLLGSVSTAVAMHAPCPVEVVRPTLSRASHEPVRCQAREQAPSFSLASVSRQI